MLRRYEFGHHYAVTEEKLTEEEQKILGGLLLSFPDANKTGSWPSKFRSLNLDEIPKKLVSIGANAFDAVGNTVLGVVAEYGTDVAALNRLIDLGAKLDTPDHNMNKSALHWAIGNRLSYYNKKSVEAANMVQCLLNKGAKPDIDCYGGETPLQYAKSREYQAAATMIAYQIQNIQKKQTYGATRALLKDIFPRKDFPTDLTKYISNQFLKTQDGIQVALTHKSTSDSAKQEKLEYMLSPKRKK